MNKRIGDNLCFHVMIFAAMHTHNILHGVSGSLVCITEPKNNVIERTEVKVSMLSYFLSSV